jgi:hypothetical protein
MDQLFKAAESAGMSKEQAEKALGAVFGFLKSSLPADKYNMIKEKFPEADGMVEAEEQDKSGGEGEGGGGGLMGAAMGAFEDVMSSTDTTALMSKLASAGIGPDTFHKFMAEAAPQIQKVTGVDVNSVLKGGGGGEEGEASSNPMGQMMGMFGK